MEGTPELCERRERPADLDSFLLGELCAEGWERTDRWLLRLSWLSSHFSMSSNLFRMISNFSITSAVDGCFFFAGWPTVVDFVVTAFSEADPGAASTEPRLMWLVDTAVVVFPGLAAFSLVHEVPTGGLCLCLHLTQAILPLVL